MPTALTAQSARISRRDTVSRHNPALRELHWGSLSPSAPSGC